MEGGVSKEVVQFVVGGVDDEVVQFGGGDTNEIAQSGNEEVIASQLFETQLYGFITPSVPLLEYIVVSDDDDDIDIENINNVYRLITENKWIDTDNDETIENSCISETDIDSSNSITNSDRELELFMTYIDGDPSITDSDRELNEQMIEIDM